MWRAAFALKLHNSMSCFPASNPISLVSLERAEGPLMVITAHCNAVAFSKKLCFLCFSNICTFSNILMQYSVYIAEDLNEAGIGAGFLY